MDTAFSETRLFSFGVSSVKGGGKEFGASSSSSTQNFQGASQIDNFDDDSHKSFALMSPSKAVKQELEEIKDEMMDCLQDQDEGPELEDIKDEMIDCLEDEDEDEELYEEDEYDDEYEYEYDAEPFLDYKQENLFSKFEDLPTGVEVEVPWLASTEPDKSDPIVEDDEIDIQYKSLKQFDTVQDYSDHHYAKNKVGKPSKDWTKRIQHDWQILEKDLPGSIYVRVYEDRLDLLRAAIEGPLGTPYHNGLFFFDVHFPETYPSVPPLVYYHSGGLRLNPNLYACGKVCLSLLGTWHGKDCEVWNPKRSTMLQVLVSIQGLILNEKPYYNEPGFEHTFNTKHGENRALKYNEDTFLLSCRTMLYSLRKPPMHFDVLVSGHFRKHGHAILAACVAYLEGATIGCDVEQWKPSEEKSDEKYSQFKGNLENLFDNLLMEFVVKGADCNKFLEQKRKKGLAK